MPNIFIKKIILMSVISLSASLALAAPQCKDISFISGKLKQSPCDSIWPILNSSNKFPDIFIRNKLLGVCYISDGDVIARIGNSRVSISTISAWTSEIIPIPLISPPIPGADNLGTVITKWTIKKAGERFANNEIYTRDTIDLSTASEQDIIVAGSGDYQNATGSVQIKSTPSPDASSIQIDSILGTICF